MKIIVTAFPTDLAKIRFYNLLVFSYKPKSRTRFPAS